MNSTEARILAERLAAADDAALARLLESRRIAPRAPWHDFFDAAEALLAPDAVARAVAALPRDALAQLAAQSGPERLGLTDPDGRPYQAVRVALGGIAPVPTPDRTPAAASESAAAHAAERAFTTLSTLADVLLLAVRTPLSRVGSGTLGASDRRRMLQAEIVRDLHEADELVALAEVTGLLAVADRAWLVTPRGAQWVAESTPVRWAHLATALRTALPAGLRSPGGGWIAPSLWGDAYPLDEEWPARARHWRRLMELTGLTAEGESRDEPPTEPAWAVSLREGGDADPAPLVALLPHEVDRVFLQNDLTAISPGPLAPALDVRLQGIATRESHAQASTYRFTESSIAGALSAGETAAGILEFLSEISLTGVPQPLEYLVQRIAERHGLVRVAVDPDSGHTVVTSRDAGLLETIAVDQALRALGLVPDGERLRTRVARETAYWALADARYPVVAVDRHGRTETLARHRIAAAEDDAGPEDRYAALVERLRSAHGADADRAWLERELDAAVRDKALLSVEVALPDGSTRSFTLEATGLGGGRLRGRDRGADVERTLPVKSITSVRHV
ncbi:helicase-associated domain-containing protein [Microbacterium album]|uniref:helicase-associated domain-containing protein n=1 Tax=Microbacterium album TaxID=2053191 RepID=UPI0016659E9C|nr:helicase-associated domain-containing protein [Microbacterium album]